MISMYLVEWCGLTMFFGIRFQYFSASMTATNATIVMVLLNIMALWLWPNGYSFLVYYILLFVLCNLKLDTYTLT